MEAKIILIGSPGAGKSTLLGEALTVSKVVIERSFSPRFSEIIKYYKLFNAVEKELKKQKEFDVCHELVHFAIDSSEFENLFDATYTFSIDDYLAEEQKEYLLELFRKCKNLVKRQMKRLQYIAYMTCNRLARSPAPQKKEPPTGGVKIGGKLHDIPRHVTEVLYYKPIFIRD